MSALDRAFIKAYSDDSAQVGQPSAKPTRGAGAPGDLSANSLPSPAAAIASQQSTKRNVVRTRRSAAAAAIRSDEAGNKTGRASGPASVASDAGTASASPTTVAAGPKAKMVVGRRALQKLAQSAVVPPPHVPLGKTDRAGSPLCQDQAVGASTRSDSLAVVAADESDIAVSEPVLKARPPAAVAHGGKASHFRLDPAAPSPQSQRTILETTPTRPAVSPPQVTMRSSTIEQPPGEATTRSNSRTTTTQKSPVAALEVDRLALPQACRVLLARVGAELEAAANIILEQVNHGSQILAVASTDEGEGCTTVTLCLAHQLAGQGARVCLVDGSFAHPQLAEVVGLAPDHGLESVLSGEIALGDVLIESIEDRLMLLPLCKPLRAEEIERAKLRRTVTLGALRDQFDIVLIDAGCVVSPAGRSSILDGGSIDAAILVGNASSQTSAWERARRTIEQKNVACLGAVENRCA